MTGQELQQRLRAQPFRPFKIVLDNGREDEVRHPALAYLATTGFLYVHKPTRRKSWADVAGPPAAFELRKISTLEPLNEAGTESGN